MKKKNSKKRPDNKFGGNYLYTKTVRPNKNYGKFVGRDGEVGIHKFIKIAFDDRKITHQEEFGTVVCELSCHLVFNIPTYWRNDLVDWTEFTAKGIAFCSKDDEFDLNKGVAIASAKAETEAYKIARRMLETIMNQMYEFAKCVALPIDKLNTCVEKNNEFIENVVDKKIEVKLKN